MHTRPLIALALWLLLLLSLGLRANDIDIPFTEVTLENGLRVVIHEDKKAPIVAVNIWYHVGSKNEQPGKTGFAHLFEHLMFNGSENFKGEYFEPLNKVGVTNINGTTNIDRTNYFQNVPKTALDLALWMESDRMGHFLGAIDQEGLDTQRGVVQNEKRQGENRPYGRVYETIQKHLFPSGHPYSWTTIGSMQDLNAASLEDVKNWFTQYYGPNNAVLAIAGDVDTAQVIERVKHYFGDIPAGPPLTKPRVWLPKLQGDKHITMQDRVPQMRIYKVWPAPPIGSEEIDLLDIGSDLLGGDKNSRLYKRLVYRDQVATDANAFLYPGELASMFIIQVSLQVGADPAKAEAAIEQELQQLLRGGPSKSELQRVQTQYRSRFIRGVERIGGFGGKSDILASNLVYTGRAEAYKDSLKRVANASSQHIKATMNAWLSQSSLQLDVQPVAELKAAGAGADRSRLPMPDSFPEVDFDKFERAILSNGMELLIATRRAVPTVDFLLRVDAGTAADVSTLAGTSNMTMSMLTEGTKKRDSQKISEQIAQLGASLTAFSGLDRSQVRLNALSENLDASLAIFADVVLAPTFPEKELQRLKNMRITQIKREKSQPSSLAVRVLPQLLFGDKHAYGQPLTGSGNEAAIAQITREHLLDYHSQWFKPNHSRMIIVGDTDAAEIVPKLEKLFSAWQPGDTPGKNITQVEPVQKERVFLLHRPEAPQSYILAGLLTGPKKQGNDLARQLMNAVYGGSFNARLNMNLREDKHWSYGARSFYLDTAAQRPFISAASVQTDKTAASMAEIRRELSDIISTRPATQEEMDKAKSKLTLSLPGRWQTAAAVSGSLAEIERFDLPDDYWNKYTNNLRSISLEQVNQAAQKNIQPESITWVIVGDRSKIEDNIRKLGYADITLLDEDGNIISQP
ncbi:MAG: insulinase family protein [Cellvibrionaceae bacterium]|nr:insulinase family protein [Cellvibrionaceae bacterium]